MRVTSIMAAAAVVATGLSISAAIVPAEAANQRLAGPNRYATSTAVAQATGLPAINVRDTSPDSLVASLNAANSGKSAQMVRNGPKLGGINRYESAAKVALKGPRNASLVVVNGYSDVDILAGASYAANKGANLLLTSDKQLPPAVSRAIATLQPTSVTIIGGTARVTESVAIQIEKITGLSAKRLGGQNRYETAMVVARAAGSKHFLLVNGANPVDAYTLPPLAKQRQASVILVRTNCTPQAVRNFLKDKTYTIIGGTAAIANNFAAQSCEQVARAAAEAARAAAAAAARNPYGTTTPKGIAYDLLPAYGWGKEQMSYLDKVFTYESKWNPTAGRINGPYGIPQANPGTKMASAGADWRTNPATQLRWGMNYIKGRYGTPSVAWAHIQRTGWY